MYTQFYYLYANHKVITNKILFTLMKQQAPSLKNKKIFVVIERGIRGKPFTCEKRWRVALLSVISCRKLWVVPREWGHQEYLLLQERLRGYCLPKSCELRAIKIVSDSINAVQLNTTKWSKTLLFLYGKLKKVKKKNCRICKSVL